MDLTCDVSFYKNYMSKYSNVRLSFVDLRLAQLYVSLVLIAFTEISQSQATKLEILTNKLPSQWYYELHCVGSKTV